MLRLGWGFDNFPQILTKSGLMGDTVTNMAFLGLVILAKTMPGQILHLVRTFKLIDNESVDKTEELIDSIIKIIETGDGNIKGEHLVITIYYIR